MSATWEDDPQYLAQVGHGFGGAFVILTATLFSVVFRGGWLPILVTLVVGIAAAAFKEFYLDLRAPEDDTFLDSLEDFGFYVLGAAVGIAEAAVALHFVGS